MEEIFVPVHLSGSSGDKDRARFRLEFGFLGQVVATMQYPEDTVIVEIGSLFGMSTITMALVSKQEVVAIDPHDGEWKTFKGTRDRRKEVGGSTLDRFVQNLEEFKVRDKVKIIQAFSRDVNWTQEDGRDICLLFLDGSHEYEDVSRDYEYFSQFLVPNGLDAFHDYGPTTEKVMSGADGKRGVRRKGFPGVNQAVNEIVEAGEIEVLGIVQTMLIGMKK